MRKSRARKKIEAALERQRSGVLSSRDGLRRSRASKEIDALTGLRKSRARKKIRPVPGNEDGVVQVSNDIFTPSEKQIRVLQVLARMTTGRISDTRICKEAGIERKTLWNWKQQPQFVAWFMSTRVTALHAELPFIDRAVINRAKAGDPSAYRTVYERMGELKKRSGEGSDDSPLAQLIDDPVRLRKVIEDLRKVELPSVPVRLVR